MKRILLTILPMMLALAVLAQSDGMDLKEGPVENGPVIININANKAPHTIDRNFSEFDEELIDGDELLRSDAISASEAESTNDKNTAPASGSGDISQNELDARDTKSADQDIVEEVKNELKIYPVPAVTDLNVDLGQEVDVEVSLMNIIGQKVFSRSGEVRSLNISVSELNSGTYFLIISFDNERITKRVQIR